MSADAAERLAIAPGLRRAIAAGELVLHHQPKLDLRTGAIAGVEALVRWRRPGHGLLPPDAFIDLAERTGLIRPLTLWVLRAAVADQAGWARAGLRIPVAVNLSARALHASVVDEVAALQERAAATGGLELEVTESAAMEDPGARPRRARAAGRPRRRAERRRLRHRALVARVPRAAAGDVAEDRPQRSSSGSRRDTASHTIVSTTVELGHRLGLAVVAEGVEDGRRSSGCAASAATSRRGSGSPPRCPPRRCRAGSAVRRAPRRACGGAAPPAACRAAPSRRVAAADRA